MRAPPIRSAVLLVVAAVLVVFVGVPIAGAGSAPLETAGTWLNVDAQNDMVSGFPGGVDWTGTVTVQVWDSSFDTVLATRSVPAEPNGSFFAPFGPRSTPGAFDIVSGEAVVATDGTNTRVMTATGLHITGVNYGSDVVVGDGAAPDRGVSIGVWSEWPTTLADTGGVPVGAVVDPDGTWVADLGATGVDLRPARLHVAANQVDDNGDWFSAELPGRPEDGLWPHIDVVNANQVEARGYDAGVDVTIHVEWPDASVFDDTKTVPAAQPGMISDLGFFLDKPLVPEAVVTLDGEAPAAILDTDFGHRELTVTPLAITGVDLASSTVSGFAGADRNVELYANEPGYAGPWARRHTFTDGTGAFPPQSFAVPGDEASAGGRMGIEDATLTLTPQGSVGLTAFDEPDFDVQSVNRPNVVRVLTLNVDPSTGLSNQQMVHLWGDGFDPNSQVGVAEGVGDGSLFTLLGTLPTDGMGRFDGMRTVSRYINGIDVSERAQLTVYDPQNAYGRNASVHLEFLPMPDPIGIAGTPTGSVNKVSGWATVGGTATCSLPGPMTLGGEVWQRISRTRLTMGTFSLSYWCSEPGESLSWQAVVRPSANPLLPFIAGTAQVTVDAEQWRYGDPAAGSATFNVKLTAPKTGGGKPR